MKLLLMTMSLALSLALVGCGSSNETPTGSLQADDHDHDHDQAHPSEGPHHGSLIELGENDYHGEFVDDHDSGTVTIYLLDSAVKNAVPIDATELRINLKHEGQAEQFLLAASPDADDPPGKSSRFVSIDEELGEDLDHDGVEAQLVVTINGKQYRGDIHHDHDHDHDH